MTDDLKWFGEKRDWDGMRGKVIVIQSWTTATMPGRKLPDRIGASLKDVDGKDLIILALHTPDGADSADAFLKKQKPPENVTIVIDGKGAFCDALGVYKQPVNILIDRQGAVRYAGLNPNGLEKAVDELVKEQFDTAKIAPKKPIDKPAADPAATPPTGAFPPVAGSVSSAKDIRGQKAPDFSVAEWITKKPKLEGKVVVIDFWATWCGPCVQAIPHMNELATKFGDKVCCIGISDESQKDFEEGLKKRKLKADSFEYNLALDPTRKMSTPIAIRGIPHCIVMSKDWTVRWQGHPASLSPEILEQIVKADSGGSGGGSNSGKTPAKKQRGWT
jgi:thiol-disulfide isomerase/thioredoxin